MPEQPDRPDVIAAWLLDRLRDDLTMIVHRARATWPGIPDEVIAAGMVRAVERVALPPAGPAGPGA
ncbi:hypothetical protein OPKNFCMD_5892 [Methylobacterium crusticola]|uniref:Uncharacterized protein n=1 Tax=Methylobacterium crusticola TaxID=1697972 RepID=A0ABQ4R8M2_9HYPH|nr:hypothetical protein [Methylobacterium crusticola]GJD53121.1 hypothetical protein OPKNFCMD_5892 [Methylobacterium crusticola]